MTKPKLPTNKPSSEFIADYVRTPVEEPSRQKMVALREQMENFIKFWEDHGIDYDKIEDDAIEKEDNKKAYPNYDQYINIPGAHNIRKWLEAVRNIQIGERRGQPRVEAVRQSTSGWNVMETFDFLNWLKFYQEGTHLKYKTAQLWYENGQPGYFLQIKPDAPKVEERSVTHQDVGNVQEELERQDEKKKIIEKQRQKIIGRLDSAEKLLRSQEGQMFAGPELENLMEAIYSLKKKVQLVNKLSTSTRLYEDMIIREGNVLHRKGFIKAANMLYSVAQANNPPPPGTGTPGPIDIIPAATPPADPSGAGNPGAPGGLPSLGPGMPQPPGSPPSAPAENQPFDPKTPSGPAPTMAVGPSSVQMDKPAPKGIAEFLEQTETGGKSISEEMGAEDELNVEDTLEVYDESILVTEAQVAPDMEDVPMTTRPSKPKTIAPPPPSVNENTKPLEVTDDTPPANEAGVEDASSKAKDFDRIIDSALANVTVADVVAKLEDITKIFKTREIPRQLSLVDMMLDSLGLSSYFPKLSEAINKSLESNNYVSTRLDEILSQLRGSLKGRDVDLKGENNAPRAPDVAQNLQQQNEKEEARKKMRKDQETAELEGQTKESPNVEINEDLGAPPTPPAAPTTPPPPARPQV